MFKLRESRITAILILIASIAITSSEGDQLDLRTLVKHVRPSVVLILGFDQAGKVTRTGSGFFASADGRIITNWHVIEGISSAAAKTEDSPVFEITGVLAGSPKLDVAILQSTARGIPFLEMERDAPPEPGTRIAVIGSPLRLEGTLSEGIVSADRPDTEGKGTWVQITAPIAPGSSGSPVLNEQAKVVGMATRTLSPGVNFARSARDVMSVYNLVPAGTSPMSFAEAGIARPTGVDVVRSWHHEGLDKTTPPVARTTPPPATALITPPQSPSAGKNQPTVQALDGPSLERAAASGDVNAEAELGFRYLIGCKGFSGDYDKAAEWFRKAADAGNNNAQFYLAFMHKEGRGIPFSPSISAPSKTELEGNYGKAFKAFEADNFAEALKELDALDARQPALAESKNLRGVLFMRQGMYDKAEAALREALRIKPKFWNARFNLAEIPFLQKNWAEARNRFQELLLTNASELQGEAFQLIQYKILLTYLVEGKENMVDSILAKFELSPDTPAVHYANAAIALQQKNGKEAKDWIVQAEKSFSPQLNKPFAESLYEIGLLQKQR